MSVISILIVEDESIVAADLANKVRNLGYEVIGITGRGAEAVDMAQHLHPNLVLMDIRLKGPIDGIEAAATIQKQHEVPVIFLTAHSDPVTLARAKITGPSGYILKPFDERDLAAQIELALYKHQADRQIREQREWLRVTLNSIGDAVIATDAEGRISFLNPVAETLTGWGMAEALEKPLQEVFRIINEHTRMSVEDPVAKVLRSGSIVGLANHTILIRKDGTEIPIDDSGAPIRDDKGRILGVILIFRDQSEQRGMQRLMQARLTLLEYATSHTLDELLTKTLDEASSFADSPVGFYHFVESDQKTFSLQQWSTRPRQKFTRTEEGERPFSLDRAGNWRDCVRWKKPVVCNDYAARCHDRGLLDDHYRVARELVIPIVRGETVVAILGVRDKAADYTEKDIEIVSYLADVTWHIIEKKRAEDALREREADYRQLFENAPVGIFTSTSGGEFLSANFAHAKTLGFDSPQAAVEHYTDLGRELYVHPEQRDRFLQALRETGRVENMEQEVRTVDGRIVCVNINAQIAQWGIDGSFTIEGFITDITEHRKLENQFRQAQKMESVGRLAGGVAHDYNNMLGVILGYAELALGSVDPADPLHRDLQEIFKAANRSAEVTRQLLAFARKQTIAPKLIDLNHTVEGMLRMLRRLIGEDIDLVWKPGYDLWKVRMDPSQIDQILANLCVNARDAIDGIGKLTIETGTVTFDKTYCEDHPGFVAGNFVMLAVSDSGCGMDKETQGKLFEPFFTTKKAGQGTGLGLSTVYGIVKQNEGFINVYSEPGKGTIFKIYLQRHEGQPQEFSKDVLREVPASQGETILIVEDEVAILNLSQTMLERLGYRVLAASTGAEVLRLAKAHAGEIHLFITDVVMPEVNGRDLAEQVCLLNPRIKTLFMSGYTANVIAHQGVLDQGVCFIQKPFSRKEIAFKVREALEQDWGSAATRDPHSALH